MGHYDLPSTEEQLESAYRRLATCNTRIAELEAIEVSQKASAELAAAELQSVTGIARSLDVENAELAKTLELSKAVSQGYVDFIAVLTEQLNASAREIAKLDIAERGEDTPS